MNELLFKGPRICNTDSGLLAGVEGVGSSGVGLGTLVGFGPFVGIGSLVLSVSVGVEITRVFVG